MEEIKIPYTHIILDTSPLIEMNNNTHRQDVFPDTWNKVNSEIKKGKIILLDKVNLELPSEIKSAIGSSNESSKIIDLSHYQDEYKIVMQQYDENQLDDEEGADPHIIAYALKLKNEGQKPLIVTSEGTQQGITFPVSKLISNIRIPTMAQHFNIDCLNNKNWGHFFSHI